MAVESEALNRALDAAQQVVLDTRTPAVTVLEAARRVLVEAGIEPEYLELRSPHELTELECIGDGALLAIAAHVGPARLIDNRILEAQ